MRRVRIGPRADRDLDDHFDYLAQDSPQAAARFLQSARQTFEDLSEMPGMGRRRETGHPRLTGLRQWRVQGFENHLIFYREVAEGIEVIRVLHAARDIDRILEET